MPIIERKNRSGERGTALLEAALSFTVFLMIIFGALDFGRMAFAYNFISYAAREATRYAMVRGTTNAATADQITTLVKNEAIGLTPSAITVTTTWTPNHTPGSTVQVQVQYSFQPIAPYMPTGPIRMSSTSQMMISQ